MRRPLPALLLLLALPVIAKPPIVGLVGGHRVGYGGVLLRAGIPYRYLDIRESCDAGELAKYDVILAANVWKKTEVWADDSVRAVDTYVDRGGKALCSMGFLPRDALPVKDRKYVKGPKPPEETGLSFALVDGDHPFLKLFPPHHAWPYGHAANRYEVDDSVTVLARFTEGEIQGEPAIFGRRYGEGEILYAAFDLPYIQGDWFPKYDDLILGAVNYLTGGRAVPAFDQTPVDEPLSDAVAPVSDHPPVPALPSMAELGAIPEGGCAIRVPLDGDRQVRVGDIFVELRGRQIELRRHGAKPVKAALSNDAQEAIVFRRTGRLDVLVDGTSIAGLDGLPAPRGRCLADHADGLVYQPCEPPYFGDDFTRDGDLTEPWRRGNGLWRLTGTGPPYVRAPSFALRGRDGWVRAGEWFWSDYRLAVSVRPASAKTIRLRIGGDDGSPGYELRVPSEHGSATLTRIGPVYEQLSEADGAAPIGQWTRLELVVIEGQVTAAIDGRQVLQAKDATRLIGGIAIGVSNGEAFLDDIEVSRPDSATALPEVHPSVFDRGPDGLMDRDTWSHPAAAWVPDPETGILWHVGRFTGDLRLAVPYRGAGLTIHAGPERDEHEVIAGAPAGHDVRWATISRTGGEWSATLDGEVLSITSPAGGSTCLGLRCPGGKILIEGLRLRAAEVSELVFEQAPAGWWSTAGDWQIGSRWPCMPQFSWLNGTARPTAEFWQKTPIAGDLVAQAMIGARMLERLRTDEQEKFDGMRLTICGNGQNPQTGYSLELAAEPAGYTRLYRGKKVVATSTVGMPPWRERHNLWVDLRLERHGDELIGWYQNRCLFRYTDPEPLKDGQVGVSTPHNTLVTPYLAVYGHEQPARPLPEKARKELAGRRWQEKLRAGVQVMPAVTVLKKWFGIPEG